MTRPIANWRQFVDVTRIIAELDAQISKLQQARALLAGVPTVKAGPGRPKGSKNTTTKSKRNLSPEGRKRIAEAMKKRWADRRKQSTKS